MQKCAERGNSLEQVYSWVKNIIIYLCLMELFCQLIPGKDYRRYVRFFGSVILLITMFLPLLFAFSVEEVFERALRTAFAQEEALKLEEEREYLAGLQNQKITNAYENELRRQIREIAEFAGERTIKITLIFEEEGREPSALKGVAVLLAKKNSGVNVFEENVQDVSGQEVAVSQIRSEIAAIYGLLQSDIDISIKE